jgi:hypothetical protein
MTPSSANTSPRRPPENATARVTVLMTPSEKRDLFARAKREGFDSVGAYMRRKVFEGESVNAGTVLTELRDRLAHVEAAIKGLARDAADAARFAFIVKYNWIGAKTRCAHGIEDGNIESARRAVDAAKE